MERSPRRFVTSRTPAFGKTIAEFQNTKFKLAELTQPRPHRAVFIRHVIAKIVTGTLDTVAASMAKCWVTDTQQEVLDECVQLRRLAHKDTWCAACSRMHGCSASTADQRNNERSDFPLVVAHKPQELSPLDDSPSKGTSQIFSRFCFSRA